MPDAALLPVGAVGFRDGYSYQQARYWLPALLVGVAALFAFLLVGNTPPLRAAGLALVVVGFTLALRPMGAVFAAAGGLALAFCPSFWIQTGGSESLNPAAVMIGLLIGAGIGWALFRLPLPAISRIGGAHDSRAWWGFGIGLAVFAAVFLLVIGQPRSLRITTLISAWTLYLLIDGLFRANPRPDSPPVGNLGVQHTLGLLLLLTIGIVNDPLMVLLAPAIALALFLSRQPLSRLYWLVLLALIAFGTWGMSQTYGSAFWFAYDPYAATVNGIQTPFIIGGAWREPARWLRLIEIVGDQFTPIGLVLGVLGLARLARWYPPIGVVTMVAYGSFALFGLVYFGGDSSVLLLPLLMLQIVWMTYALYTFWQWGRKYLK